MAELIPVTVSSMPKRKQSARSNEDEPNLYAPTFTSGMIADYFKYLYGDYFVCVNEKLYSFNGVYWEEEDKKYSNLVKFFDKTFYADLIEYANRKLETFTSLLPNDEDPERLKNNIAKVNEFLTHVNTLRKNHVRKSYIEEIVIWLTNNSIKFNSNIYLFAFKNKVFDLKIGDFVEPRPEFYMTQTANYDYMESSPEAIQELDRFIDSIFPNPEVKEDYLTILATGLSGIHIENCIVATGSGRNGKGVINSLMMKTVGDYGYVMPSHALLYEIKDGPNPEMANLHNKRFVLSTEPEKGRKINCSAMKKLTGDDTLPVRGLYSSNTETYLKGTMVIEANQKPLLDEVNPAVTMRIRIDVFESTFYTLAEYEELDPEAQKIAVLGDPYYKTEAFQIKNRCVLFDLLRPYFAAFQENMYRLKPMPKVCALECRDYLAVSDDIYSWFTEYFERTETIEESEAILLTEVYDMFKGSSYFLNMNKADKRKFNRKYFCEEVEKNMFLRKCVKPKGTYHNKVQIKGDYLLGWKRIDSLCLLAQTIEEMN